MDATNTDVGPLVGIDLGTTHTVVAVLTDTGPIVIPGPDGSPLLPSAVAEDADGHLLVGAAALARIARAPASGARWFKRDMAGERRYRIGTREYTPTELSAMVLREAKGWAERHLGVPVTRVVITVPAYFHEPQRVATREAAELAGLTIARIINEPTAAALAHGLTDPERERRIAVLDLGGGTFDVTLLELYAGVLEVTGTGGDGRLGGEDFTDALWAHACKEAGLAAPSERPTPVQGRLREGCDLAKRELGRADFARVELPRADAVRWEPARELVVTRGLFDALTRPLLDRMVSCVRDTLVVTGKGKADIDEVVLAGGATRMAAVVASAEALFGRAPVVGLDPDHAIALGAALQAGLIVRHRAVEEVVVTDVVGHSLGVEVSRPGADRVHTGYFLPVIHRNTTLPTRRVERVWTGHPRQDEVRILVYEGEHRYTRENQLLEELVIKDLAPADDPENGRVALDIAFTHDINGLLEVEVTLVGRPVRASVLIENRAGRMTPAERAAAVEALARLKVPPRDLLPNRLLLEEALARHAALRPPEQALLDPVLFAFEDALERQHPEAVRTTADALRAALGHRLLAPDPS